MGGWQSSVERIRPSPQGRPRPTYTEEEVRRLIAACPEDRWGVRDKAAVLVLYDTGLRVGELLAMDMPSWDQRLVAVQGKTGHRSVPIGATTAAALERYLRRWRIAGPPLWRGKYGPLTGAGVKQMIERLCQAAGVEYKAVHAFRRGAAAQMKRLGMNDSDIMQVCGWKSVEMLRRYTSLVGDELAQVAHARFSPADRLDKGATAILGTFGAAAARPDSLVCEPKDQLVKQAVVEV